MTELDSKLAAEGKKIANLIDNYQDHPEITG